MQSLSGSSSSECQLALIRLERRRVLAKTPEDISLLTFAEALDERAAVKGELALLKRLAAETRSFTQEDKKIMNDLYRRYCDLKLRQVELERERSGSQSSASKNQELLAEKRALQVKLHKHQTQFLAIHGRPVAAAEDWGPVSNDYKRYKILKKQLA